MVGENWYIIIIRNLYCSRIFTYIICTHRDAINEILKDTKRGAVRSEISGAYGWKAAPKINPRLFGNTLIQVLQTNRRKTNVGISKKNNRNTSYQRTNITKDKVTRHKEINTASKRYQSSSVMKRSKNVSDECKNSNHQKDDIIPVNEGNGD